MLSGAVSMGSACEPAPPWRRCAPPLRRLCPGRLPHAGCCCVVAERPFRRSIDRSAAKHHRERPRRHWHRRCGGFVCAYRELLSTLQTI